MNHLRSNLSGEGGVLKYGEEWEGSKKKQTEEGYSTRALKKAKNNLFRNKSRGGAIKAKGLPLNERVGLNREKMSKERRKKKSTFLQGCAGGQLPQGVEGNAGKYNRSGE